MVWAASGIGVPLQLGVATVNGVRGMAVVLDEAGDVACFYMGTDASLPNMGKLRRAGDAEAAAEEMELLDEVIRTAALGGESESGIQVNSLFFLVSLVSCFTTAHVQQHQR